MNSAEKNSTANSETTRHPHRKWMIGVAVTIAVLLPITAFAGIGAWNGVQKVFLGTAVEIEPAVSTEESASETKSPTRSYTASSRSEQDRASRPGFLGVSTSTLTNQLRDTFAVPHNQGVLVTEVNDNSAAEAAGLQAGDVIVSVDGDTIRDSGDLGRAIRRAGADTNINLAVIRNGQSRDFAATLGVNESRKSYRVYRNSYDADDDAHDDADGSDERWEGSRGGHWDSDDWNEEDIEAFTARMEAFGERMAEWGDEFGETFGDRWAEEFERNGEEFGRRMEEWGEAFGRRMEEKFENGDWDNRSFHFNGKDGDWDEAEFEAAMEKLHEQLADLDLDGIGTIVEKALSGINWESINTDVAKAVEDAMKALDRADGGRDRE